LGRLGIFGGGEVPFFRLTFFFLGTRVRGGTGKKGKERVVSSMNRIYCINTECATCYDCGIIKHYNYKYYFQ